MKQRFYFLGYILRRVPNCNCMFNFFRNLRTVFHSDCTKINFHQHIRLLSVQPCQQMISSCYGCCCFETVSHNVIWIDLQLMILLPQPFLCCVYRHVPPCLSWYVLTFWWHHSSECNVILAWCFWFFSSCLLMTLNRCSNHSISMLAIFNVFFEEMTFLLTWSFLHQAIYISM